MNAYYDSDYCWYRFNAVKMIVATEIEVSNEPLKYVAGAKQQLSAKLLPENATLPTVYWHSTNPEIASVSPDSLVTYHALKDSTPEARARAAAAAAECKIIATTLYADGPVAEFTVEGVSSSVPSIGTDNGAEGEFDPTAPYEVYNLSGMRISGSLDNLVPGIYIVRQGSIVIKTAVR